MTAEISFIDNAKPPHWYGCTFVFHKGKPLLIECRYVAGKADMPIGGNKPPQHVYSHIITYLATKADHHGIALMEYPELDRKRDSSVRAKKRPMSNLDITNAALKKLVEGGIQPPRIDAKPKNYETGMRRTLNIIPLYGTSPAADAIRAMKSPAADAVKDAAELQQMIEKMIEKMIAAGFFFPQPPSKPEDGKA